MVIRSDEERLSEKMQEFEFTPQGVCASRIRFLIDNETLVQVRFDSGCEGNLLAVGRLVEGMKVREVIQKLKGIDCEGKQTSCPDQLARALEKVITANK